MYNFLQQIANIFETAPENVRIFQKVDESIVLQRFATKNQRFCKKKSKKI